VGVALIKDQLAVHYRHLPPLRPLFYENRISAKDKEELRKIGSHAARLVKGISFKHHR